MRRRLMIAGGALGAVALLFLGQALGAAGANHSAKSRIAAVQTSLDASQAKVKDLADQVSSQKARADRLDANAAAVAAEKDQLDKQASALQQQQASLQQQQAAVDASSFGDGLYQVGKDIKPGQYHTAGDTHCYWAKLHSSDTTDIIDNNLNSGPQTVTINSPFFTTNGCGTWTKVG